MEPCTIINIHVSQTYYCLSIKGSKKQREDSILEAVTTSEALLRNQLANWTPTDTDDIL